MKELRASGAILAILALLVIAFRCKPAEKPAPPAPPIEVSLENDRQLDSLKRFIDSLNSATPDTVRVAAPRYIKKHDTLWRLDTLRDTVAKMTEVTRWLMLSDSTQRQKLDSVTRMDSLHRDERDTAASKLRATSDSLRQEEKALHWKDAAVGGIGTILLLSATAGTIFVTR